MKQLSGFACHDDGSAYAVSMSDGPQAMLELLHRAKKFVMVSDIVASDRPASTLSSPIMEFSESQLSDHESRLAESAQLESLVIQTRGVK